VVCQTTPMMGVAVSWAWSAHCTVCYPYIPEQYGLHALSGRCCCVPEFGAVKWAPVGLCEKLRLTIINQSMPWAWRKTAWEVALCAEGSGFDPCPPHGAFLWGNGIVIVRLAEWPVPLWGLSEG